MSTQFPLHFWAHCSRNVSLPGRQSREGGTGWWDPSTMSTFKMSHIHVHSKDNTAAICITEHPAHCRHLTLFLSGLGMSRIIAWLFDCEKGGLPFWRNRGESWELEVIVRVLFLWSFFSSLCVAMSEHSVKMWGAALMGPLVWDLLSMADHKTSLCDPKDRINCYRGKNDPRPVFHAWV